MTINSLDITIPNTPIGDMGFDGSDPIDETNPLESVMRPLVGLTYDPTDRLIKPSKDLTKQRGTSALGHSFNRPYITPVFAPFMIFQGDASPKNPRSFMMVPYANGFQVADPSPIDYITSKRPNGDHTTNAVLDATFEELELPGVSTTASLVIEGNSTATHDHKAKQLKNHTYELTSNLRFEYAPGSPLRAVLHTKVTIERSSARKSD